MFGSLLIRISNSYSGVVARQKREARLRPDDRAIQYSRGGSCLNEISRRTGCPAFAGHDNREIHLRILAAPCASFAGNVPPSTQRAQGMPGAQCARSLVCEIKKHTSIVTTVTPESPGIPRAMVLTVSFALSSVTGLVCHRHRRKLPLANLTPASGRQDHTTSPSSALVRSAARVH